MWAMSSPSSPIHAVVTRQHCRLTICIELVELTNSIRWQDPNINTDTETRCLVYPFMSCDTALTWRYDNMIKRLCFGKSSNFIRFLEEEGKQRWFWCSLPSKSFVVWRHTRASPCIKRTRGAYTIHITTWNNKCKYTMQWRTTNTQYTLQCGTTNTNKQYNKEQQIHNTHYNAEQQIQIEIQIEMYIKCENKYKY